MTALDVPVSAYVRALERETDPGRQDAILQALEAELARYPLQWLQFFFPQYLTHGFAPHHEDFWAFVWTIELGVWADAFIAIWPRGGAKSTSLELAVAALGARGKRAYVLYVSDTQDQADKHVGTIKALIESSKIGQVYPQFGTPAVGKFGDSKGWRRNRLTTLSGFTIDAIGLDTASRGVKVEEQRPDLIIFDDLDDATDSPKVTQTKIDRLTRTILPTGGDDTVVLGAQNVVIPNGIFARLAGVAEQQADFLTTAKVSGPIPALRELSIEQLEPDERGRPRWKIVHGIPTWKGQGLDRCQRDLDTYGRTAFLIERQHQAQLRAGGIFRAWEWLERHFVDGPLGEEGIHRVRAWDTAGTEDTGMNDPDWTVGVLLAYDTQTFRYRIEDVQRWRATAGETKRRARAIAEDDCRLGTEHENLDRVHQIVEQEPGWHGRDWVDEWVSDVFRGLVSHKVPTFGKTKPERAEFGASIMENGLVEIVRANWNPSFQAELEAFADGDHDDQVDAYAYAANYLRRYGDVTSGTGVDALRAMSVPRRR